MNGDIDLGTEPRQRFVDRVINNFIDKMMQRFNVRATHVHTRAFADMLDTFQRLDGTDIVIDVVSLSLATKTSKVLHSQMEHTLPVTHCAFQIGSSL